MLVLHRRFEADLLLKLYRIAGHTRLEYLDGHFASDPLIVGKKDPATGPLAEYADDFIAPDRFWHLFDKIVAGDQLLLE